MSQSKIRDALETALASITPAIDTAWQNIDYTPSEGVPYQRAWLLPADDENPTMGDGFHRERGIMQVSLYYPKGKGTAEAAARAELVKALFARGASFSEGGVTTQIERTPTIATGSQDEGCWKVPIRIRYFANI